MPTYVYRREDGSTFELTQRISDAPLTHDPETGQSVERVISGAGLVFKGSGFYLTDYARKGGEGPAKKAEGAADTPAKVDEAKADAPKAEAKKPDPPAKPAP